MMILMLYAIKIKIHIERRIIFMKTKKNLCYYGNLCCTNCNNNSYFRSI